MNRVYETGTQTKISLFEGIEIENTPAKGMETLFVVGVLPVDEIERSIESYTEHIYFGANQSFQLSSTKDIWLWEEMIFHFLKKDVWCTLDFDIREYERVLECGFCEYRKFIPQISVKLPYLQQLNYNATIKIDDKDFDATNPGVWCIPLGDLLDRKYFTIWDLYKKDKVIK
jgi:hypothetical protein